MSAPAKKGGWVSSLTSTFANFGTAAYSKVNRSSLVDPFVIGSIHVLGYGGDSVLWSARPGRMLISP